MCFKGKLVEQILTLQKLLSTIWPIHDVFHLAYKDGRPFVQLLHLRKYVYFQIGIIGI